MTAEIAGHSTGGLYPCGIGTKQVGGSSGQCLSLCSKCALLCSCFIAFSLSKQGGGSLSESTLALEEEAVLRDGAGDELLEVNIHMPTIHNVTNTSVVTVDE